MLEINNFKPLRVLALRFHLLAKEQIQLPPYSGSAWRGLFGHSLKQVECVTHTPLCSNCKHYFSCVHSAIFEAPIPADSIKMRRYPSSPHPYVIRPNPKQKRGIAVGESTWVDVLVYGNCVSYSSSVIEALQRAGDTGIGDSRGKFKVTKIEQLHDNNSTTDQDDSVDKTTVPYPGLAPPPEHTVSIQLNTPLRIRINKHYLNSNTFSARAFFSTLLRRYSMLSYFQENFDPPLDYKGLLDSAESLKVTNSQLLWCDLKRYSSRQNKQVPMGGLVGKFELSGQPLQILWPLLYHGQQLHLGKGTVMGLGQYTLHVPQACDARNTAIQ